MCPGDAECPDGLVCGYGWAGCVVWGWGRLAQMGTNFYFVPADGAADEKMEASRLTDAAHIGKRSSTRLALPCCTFTWKGSGEEQIERLKAAEDGELCIVDETGEVCCVRDFLEMLSSCCYEFKECSDDFS